MVGWFKLFEGEFVPPAMGSKVAPINVAGKGKCTLGSEGLIVEGNLVTSRGPLALLVVGAYLCLAMFLRIEFRLEAWLWSVLFTAGLSGVIAALLQANAKRRGGKPVRWTIPWNSIERWEEDDRNEGVMLIVVKSFKPRGALYFKPDRELDDFVKALGDAVRAGK